MAKTRIRDIFYNRRLMQIEKLLFLILLLFVLGCNRYIASDFEFPDPIHTGDQPITFQKKGTFSFAGVYADNQFDGARLNGFSQIDDSTFSVKIQPENFPINPSPWYAFRMWSDTTRKINLLLDYDKSNHRYWPKTSSDGLHWTRMDTTQIFPLDNQDVVLELWLSPDTLWVAGQEVINSGMIKNWCEDLNQHPEVEFSIIGKSKLGRDMYFLDIGSGGKKGKKVIAVLSRQHPPEVTGYLAMESFVENAALQQQNGQGFQGKIQDYGIPLNESGWCGFGPLAS